MTNAVVLKIREYRSKITINYFTGEVYTRDVSVL